MPAKNTKKPDTYPITQLIAQSIFLDEPLCSMLQNKIDSMGEGRRMALGILLLQAKKKQRGFLKKLVKAEPKLAMYLKEFIAQEKKKLLIDTEFHKKTEDREVLENLEKELKL